jgi:hypothetical protein
MIDGETTEERFDNISLSIPRLKTPARFGRVGTLSVTAKRLIFLIYGSTTAYTLDLTKITSRYPSAFPRQPTLGCLEVTLTCGETFSFQGPVKDICLLQEKMPFNPIPGTQVRKKISLTRPVNSSSAAPAVGVGAIVQRAQEQADHRGQAIQNVTTLDDLRRSASELVSVAQTLATMTDPESASELSKISREIGIRRSGDRSGVPGLATEFAGDMAAFFAKQKQKILPLPEAFALYHRIRLSQQMVPKEIRKAVDWIKTEDSFPVRVEEIGKVTFIVARDASFDETVRSIVGRLGNNEGISPMAFSQQCELPLSIAKNYLLRAEAQGLVARDDSLLGLRFYKNLFPSWQP